MLIGLSHVIGRGKKGFKLLGISNRRAHRPTHTKQPRYSHRSAPPKLFLSLEHPATSQHRQNGSPSRSLVSTELLRLLERLSRLRNARIGDMDDIADFDSRETSYQVETIHNESLLTFLQLPLLQVRIPRLLDLFCAQRIPPSKYLEYQKHQIRTIPSSSPHTSRNTTTLRPWTNHPTTGTSPTLSRASTAVSPIPRSVILSVLCCNRLPV